MSLPPLDIPGLLRRYDLRPDKSLGQNFLIDPAALHSVVAAAEIDAGSAVLEIGPGLGSLTRLLAGKARRVVAIELDEKLIQPLGEILKDFSNIEIIQGDILALNPAVWLPLLSGYESDAAACYQVVANIPYYITSALIRHLLEAPLQPNRMALTVQREVAGRICAAPGDLSLLALSVQVYGSPRIAAHIPAGAFYPPPKVDSAVVRVDIYPEPAISPEMLPIFFRLAKAGFSQKRKNLRNALSGGMAWKTNYTEDVLAAAGIDPRRRAETLSLAEWQCLAQASLAQGSLRLTPNPK